MKVVTLKIPVCDNYLDVAELTMDEQGFSTKEEYFAHLALKGICTDFHDEDTARQIGDYFKELVRMVYTKELAGETRQDDGEDLCKDCFFENETRADCCEYSRRMYDMYTPAQTGRRSAIKMTYDVIVWIAAINRETHMIEPKDVLIAQGLRTKRSAQKYIEFFKEEYGKKENKYEILVSDRKEAERDA